MNKTKMLEQAKELLKAAKEKPEQFQGLGKSYEAGGLALTEPVMKDDAPHAPNSPEDKAHDVAEQEDSIPKALEILDTPEKQKAMLAHLRTLHEPDQQRSEENKEAGMTQEEKENKMDKSEILKAAKQLLELAKNEPEKFQEELKKMDKMAPAPAPAPAPAAPMTAQKMGAPKARTGMMQTKNRMMTKAEIKEDLKKPWAPKSKKMEGC